MKNVARGITLFVMLIIAALILTVFSLAQSSSSNIFPGERTNVIVQIESGRSPNSVLSFPGFQLKREINWRDQKYIVGSVPSESYGELGNLPGVLHVYEDYELPLALNQTIRLIGATQLHDLGIRGQGESICIIDSGIDYTHPDLDGGKVVNGYDFIENDADPFEAYGTIGSHGNWLSIVAAGDGSINTGVAPDASIVVVRACREGTCPVSNVLSGMQFCVENIENNDITVIQTAVGGATSSVYCDADPRFPPLMTDLTNEAVARDVMVTAATGNEDSLTHIGWPACIKNSTAVAGSSPPPFADLYIVGNRNSITDLVAPFQVKLTNPDQSPVIVQGTSISVPHVSGSVALIQNFLAQNQKYATPEEIGQAFETTGVAIQDALPPNGTGLTFKRISVYNAAIWLRDRGLNHAPIILNYSPTQSNLSLTRGDTQLFSATTRDPDPADVLDIWWYVNNNRIQHEDCLAGQTCTTNFNYTFSTEGMYEVFVSVGDSHSGTAQQIWNVNVTRNTAPRIDSFSPLWNVTMGEGAQQLFTISASDAENDPLSVEWLVDFELKETDNCVPGVCNAAFTYSPNFFSAGTHNVRGVVGDGELMAYKEWQVTVQNVPAPDFTVLQLWKQSPRNRDPRPGERFVAGVRIKNIGETSAQTIYEVNFGDATQSFRSSPFSLDAGKTKTVYVSHTYANAGTYNLILRVDPDNTRPELREDNNEKNLTVSVHN